MIIQLTWIISILSSCSWCLSANPLYLWLQLSVEDLWYSSFLDSFDSAPSSPARHQGTPSRIASAQLLSSLQIHLAGTSRSLSGVGLGVLRYRPPRHRRFPNSHRRPARRYPWALRPGVRPVWLWFPWVWVRCGSKADLCRRCTFVRRSFCICLRASRTTGYLLR